MKLRDNVVHIMKKRPQKFKKIYPAVFEICRKALKLQYQGLSQKTMVSYKKIESLKLKRETLSNFHSFISYTKQTFYRKFEIEKLKFYKLN